MPRTRDSNRDKAFEIYKNHKGNIDLVKVASQLKISPGTVRGWKSKDKWDDKLNGTFQKNTERSKPKKESIKEVFVEEADQVMENPDLTEKQRLFCIYYVRCFNATKAYQKAYDCSYETAMANGYKILRNTQIKNEILQLKQNRLNREYFAKEDVFQKYMDIAFSDITDYVTFGTEEVPVMTMYGPAQIKDEKTGKKKTLTKVINTVRFKESTNIDGTLISEVKQGRDGASIKLLDKMKALNWLAEHMNMATEEQRARIEQIKANTERMRAGGGEEEEDGVTIINDAPTGEDIGYRDTEVSEDIQQ